MQKEAKAHTTSGQVAKQSSSQAAKQQETPPIAGSHTCALTLNRLGLKKEEATDQTRPDQTERPTNGAKPAPPEEELIHSGWDVAPSALFLQCCE